jgi:putative transposase
MPRREPLTEPPAPAFAELTAPQREQAMGRFAVLRPHLEQDVPLARSALAAGVPVRTAERWLARYRLDGLVGLARAPRADLGRGQAAAEVIETIEGLYLRKPRPSVASIRRRLLKVAKERHWTVPSYTSI